MEPLTLLVAAVDELFGIRRNVDAWLKDGVPPDAALNRQGELVDEIISRGDGIGDAQRIVAAAKYWKLTGSLRAPADPGFPDEWPRIRSSLFADNEVTMHQIGMAVNLKRPENSMPTEERPKPIRYYKKTPVYRYEELRAAIAEHKPAWIEFLPESYSEFLKLIRNR